MSYSWEGAGVLQYACSYATGGSAMSELLAVIPFLDIIIVLLLFASLLVGWTQGIRRLMMIAGALYTGFLLASVYYHLFAVSLSSIFGIESGFVADLVSFAILQVLVTVLMVALLLSLFGHVEIKGRAAVFDKVLGSVMGLFVGVFVIGILITLLRVPFEANMTKLNSAADMPIILMFNSNYEKSTLAGNFMRTTPVLMSSVVPLLPAETRERGAVPLLESVLAQR